MTDVDPARSNKYLDALRASGLIPDQTLREELERLTRSHAGKVTIATLSQQLEEAGFVTAWQNQHLLQGRKRGFMLNQYKLLDCLGVGGMGTVYLGEHALMGRKVAIKVLSRTAKNQVVTTRFQIEGRAIAALDHPNIVRAYDFNQTTKYAYLVMEFVDGSNLEQLVERQGPVKFEDAATYIRQAAAGLDHAHSLNIVHRDIKPSNLMLDDKGNIRVMDLGLARVLDPDAFSLTVASAQDILGTIDFLAPEQAVNSHDVDARADIYSLGGTLYYLLT